MYSDSYAEILLNAILPYANEEIQLLRAFQEDNGPKHIITHKIAKMWFEERNVNVMEPSPQSADIKPIENFWSDVKDYLNRCM